MIPAIITLIIVLITIAIIIIFGLYIKNKVSNFTEKYFGTRDLKEAIDKTEIEASETPKSIATCEDILIKKIYKDFPNLNINELKSQSNNAILKVLNSIEQQDKDAYKDENPELNEWIISLINDNKNVKYDKIKIHRTAVYRYEKTSSTANISFQTSLEYIKTNNKFSKKIQDRIITEFIYIYDINRFNSNIKAIFLRCPNCAAPIKDFGNKTCEYCGTAVIELPKKYWLLNKIKKD